MDAPAASGPPGPPGNVTAGEAPPGFGAARLLCLVGYHAPDASMVWHQGYGFAHCRRCRQGIVRSLLSNWVVPGPGLRIVWPKVPAGVGPSPEPRPTRATVSTAASPPASPQPVSEPELPMSEPTAMPVRVERDSEVDDAVVPVIMRGKAQPAAEAAQPDSPEAAAADVQPQPPLAIAPDSAPKTVDLLGPNFMGPGGAPPGPRGGMEVFEFDDMAAGDAGFASGGGLAAQRAS